MPSHNRVKTNHRKDIWHFPKKTHHNDPVLCVLLSGVLVRGHAAVLCARHLVGHALEDLLRMSPSARHAYFGSVGTFLEDI